MANTLNLFRDGAVGFIDWLGLLRLICVDELPNKVSFFSAVWVNNRPIENFGLRKRNVLPLMKSSELVEFVQDATLHNAILDRIDVNKHLFKIDASGIAQAFADLKCVAAWQTSKETFFSSRIGRAALLDVGLLRFHQSVLVGFASPDRRFIRRLLRCGGGYRYPEEERRELHGPNEKEISHGRVSWQAR